MQIEFGCELSEMSVRDFSRTLSRLQRETQRDMRGALRSATTDLLKSLRKQTKKSPDKLPRRAFRFGQSDPQWITNPDGSVHRRMVVKKFGKPDSVFFQEWKRIEKVDRKGRHSWTQASEASLIRDARNSWHGKIWNAGLAKRTWGWMMWRLFNLPDDGKFINPRVNITHRHCEASITEARDPLPDGTISLEAPIKCDIKLINRMRYIFRALPPHAVAQAVESARRSITAKIDRGLKSRRFD